MTEIPDITNLGLSDEELEIDYDNMPEEGGGFDPICQPGTYDWQLPKGLLAHLQDEGVFKNQPGASGIPASFQITLKDSFKLKNLTTGTSHRIMFSNRMRKLGEGTVSDIALILRAVGVKPNGSNNSAYLKAFLEACAAEAMFTADAQLSCTCNEKNDIYTKEGRKDGVKGCGTRYDQDGYTVKNGKNAGTVVHPIPKEAGRIPDQFECGRCPALLRPWMNLRRFKAIEG